MRPLILAWPPDTLGLASTSLFATKAEPGIYKRKPEKNWFRACGDEKTGWRAPQSTFAATHSTSTLNCGREKPETIIKVEAGGGSPTWRSRTRM